MEQSIPMLSNFLGPPSHFPWLFQTFPLENGQLSDRCPIRTDTGCIVSNRIGYVVSILPASLQVHQLLTERITHDNHRAFRRPVTRPPRTHACILFYGPWYGRGFEGREAEGDYNLIPASLWHKDSAVLVLTTITPHSLHQQEVITTVSCQSL